MPLICHQYDALELKRKRKDKIRWGVVKGWLLMVVDVTSVNTTDPELVLLTVLKLTSTVPKVSITCVQPSTSVSQQQLQHVDSDIINNGHFYLRVSTRGKHK